jgi:sugar phosphate isomerase/epimerase
MNSTQNRRTAIKKLMMASLIPATVGSVVAMPVTDATNKKYQLQNKRGIYVFSKVLQWIPVMELPAVAKKMGYDGIDLTVREGGHIEPKDVKSVLPAFVEKCLAIGLQHPLLTTTILDPTDKESMQVIETAGKLGIKHYRMGWYNYDFKQNLKNQLEALKSEVSKIADQNRKFNISGNYQNHSGNSVGAAVWDGYQLVNQNSTEYCGLEYDIRHAMVEGAFSWPVNFELIKNKIRVVDIKDFRWSSDKELKPINVPLGEGVVDFTAFVALLNKNKLYTPMSIHLEHDLGGAELGSKSPSISEDEIIKAVTKDLNFLKNLV